MRILLFGKDGQVGHELQRTLLPFGPITACNRTQADFTQATQLFEVCNTVRPDLIVNAAAYTAVDKAETERDTAFKINAEAVASLANYAKINDILLVHYSTDYVFDGNQENPYREDDATNPLNTYGLSKRAGELAILDSGCKALILRTSWVFSAHGNNFIKTILRLGKEKSTLSIVNDQFGAPTSAELIADVTALAIGAYRSGRLPTGIYHLTASGSTHWHGFACHIVERALANGFPLNLSLSRIGAIPTEDYPLPARRPKHSALSTLLLCERLGLDLPDWSVHANRTIDQLTRIN